MCLQPCRSLLCTFAILFLITNYHITNCHGLGLPQDPIPIFVRDHIEPLTATNMDSTENAVEPQNFQECYILVQVTKRIGGQCVKMGQNFHGCVAGNFMHPFHQSCIGSKNIYQAFGSKLLGREYNTRDKETRIQDPTLGSKMLPICNSATCEITLSLEGTHALQLLKTKNVCCVHLKKLYMNQCKLDAECLNKILALENLMELKLNRNELPQLAPSIFKLHNLTKLNLSFNLISDLPSEIKDLPLKLLNLSHNKLLQVPEVLFTGLSSISSLDLSHNKINDFDKPPKCLRKLNDLNVSYNDKLVPCWMHNPQCHLTNVDLSGIEVHCNLTLMWKTTFHFTTLRTITALTLMNCKLTDNSLDFLLYLKCLVHLNMGNKGNSNSNFFSTLPCESLWKLVSFMKLEIENVGLSILPQSIAQLRSLTELNISHNEITWLPDIFCDIVSLQACYFNNCNLVLLHDNIGKLLALQELYLAHNYLTRLPCSIRDLVHLKYLDLYHNDLEEVPECVMALEKLEGIDLDMNYLVDNMGEKYLKLKQALRGRLVNHEARCDGQKEIPKSSSSCESESSVLSGPENVCTHDDAVEDVCTHDDAVEDVCTHDDAVEDVCTRAETEMWTKDEESFQHEPHVPEVTEYPEDDLKPVSNSPPQYCPGVSHPISHCNMFRKSRQTQNNELGQFDLD